MRIAKDEVIEKEIQDEENSVSAIVNGIKDKIRTLSNERENDRYLG